MQIKPVSQKQSSDVYRLLVCMFRLSYRDFSSAVNFDLFSDLQFEQSKNKEYLLEVLNDTKVHTTLIALDDVDKIVGTIGLKVGIARLAMNYLRLQASH